MTRMMRLYKLIAILAVIAAQPATAQTIIVRNVHGVSQTSDGIESFSGLIIVNGKVERLLSANVELPQIAGATFVDAGGKTLLPGLIDAHGHVLGLGQLRLQADLRGGATLAIALDRVRAFASANRSDRWVLGRGWNQVLWQGQQFPTASQLDAVVSDRPALLTRIDGHAVWVNSAALQRAGITRATQDPPGGQILRNASGDPTGVLIDTATTLVERYMPQPTDIDIQRTLLTAMQELASLGITGVHDAGVDARTYRAYQELGAAGQLPIRIYAMVSDDKTARDLIVSGPKPLQFDDRLQMRAVKAWVDGALGSRGAAMLAGYSDQPSHHGLMLYTPEELLVLAKLVGVHGWQLSVHAIGDAGNRIALDAFERGSTAAQRTALRPRIEHAQVISLADIPRFTKLGVIASIQPTHATSDMNMAEDRVGAERIKGAYAWRKLKNSGVRLAGGSDFPVELANPFHGLYAAITRKNRQGKPPTGWYPQENLTREEALRLFTVDAAYAAHMEGRVGSLRPGQWADFILIDRDYFKVPENEIDDIQVLATYMAGKKVASSGIASAK